MSMRVAKIMAAAAFAVGLAACDDTEEVEVETPEGEVEVETETTN